MGARRKGRELALKLLFQLDFDKDNLAEAVETFWSSHPCGPETKEFAHNLVMGTLAELETIDRLLNQYAEHWRLERMAVVDRNILRFAAYELCFLQDIPPKVTINEALEIAKKYSSPDSSKFINGILDKIANKQGEKDLDRNCKK